MKLKKLHVLYFSPTGGTEKIARLAAGELAAKLGLEQAFIDFTRPENRRQEYRFGGEDLLVMASPSCTKFSGTAPPPSPSASSATAVRTRRCGN